MKKKENRENRRHSAPHFARRKRLNIALSLLLAILLLAVLAGNIIYNMRNYTVEFYNISAAKVSEEIKIVYLTDLHLREYGEGNAYLLQDIENLAPDMILLGGDLVLDDVAEHDSMFALCRALTQIAPAWGVWGNHEDVKMYIQGDKALRESFEATGVRFLTNEIEEIEIGGSRVAICGVDGNSAGFASYGAKEAIERLSEMTDCYRICLAHVPSYLANELADYDFELGLAGHVHGGIVQLPKFGALYSAEEGFFPTYADGAHTLKNGAEMIVSRGLGQSGRIPRVNNIPELSVIDVN